MKFLGYERPDGSVGIRNHVLVIPNIIGSLIATKICDFVGGTKTILIPSTHITSTIRDKETAARSLIGLGRNPNVASVIVDNNPPVYEEIAKSGKRVELLEPAKDGGTLGAISKGIKFAREMVHEASKVRREPFDVSHLVLGVKCGGSDATSGIAGNPVVGNLFDRVVEAGGTAIFGENTEIIGAEHILAKRGVNEEVSKGILQAAHEIEEAVKSVGEDIRTINPVPANIAGGISSLEEKSLGAIHKSGSAPIQGVLKYGERPGGKGLYFSDSHPGTAIWTGFAASGAQLLLCSTGTTDFPASMDLFFKSPGVIAPLLFTTANPKTVALSLNSVDFYSGTVLEGKDTIESAGEKLLQMVLEIACGTMTKEETIKHTDAIYFYFKDPIF